MTTDEEADKINRSNTEYIKRCHEKIVGLEREIRELEDYLERVVGEEKT